MPGDGVRKPDEIISAASSMIAAPIAMDRHFTGLEATSSALMSYTLAACAAGLANFIFGSLFGIGLVPGALEIVVGDVSIQMTGPSYRSFIHYRFLQSKALFPAACSLRRHEHIGQIYFFYGRSGRFFSFTCVLSFHYLSSFESIRRGCS